MKRINLALQGGGAHGAFTWGVLDRILEDDRIEIAAISGTSAGAMNGAALKAGMATGGREGAKENLDWFWEQIGAVKDDALVNWMDAIAPATPMLAAAMAYSPSYAAIDMTTRMLSPYASGALYSNPLTSIVEKFHYDDVCGEQGPELYVGATNVRTGKIKVFSGGDITGDALMASACLPTMFQAVEIDGEAYWDGGYTGNPALFPLFGAGLPSDIVVININPLHRDEIPNDPQSIQNRINEISFNSSLFRELRAINFVKRLILDGTMDQGKMRNVLVHMVSDDVLMNDLNVATKSVANPVVLARLKSAGRTAANRFLEDHFDDLGERDTVDLEAMFSG
ncbi:patatin-like phospholipase family protein [Octadecabacter sp. G9-8]|uniref:Patatin-like phospholipase family protein n=1 Tax=Octadecabacter dasysiphoniae TaxID=2909341 RepID=A0ABS9CWU4_9RHOB|nr:patatin-like phospholipase family protein [Octadecabacter dasysiphoniae]MCF2870631.1 patatin-like phospholipase family protein [Octadecabacter dasysiphoniae]